MGHPALRQATTLVTLHYNHGRISPQAGLYRRRSQSLPLGPAGNRHGKKAHDVQPFFEEEGEQKICLLCWYALQSHKHIITEKNTCEGFCYREWVINTVETFGRRAY